MLETFIMPDHRMGEKYFIFILNSCIQNRVDALLAILFCSNSKIKEICFVVPKCWKTNSEFINNCVYTFYFLKLTERFGLSVIIKLLALN